MTLKFIQKSLFFCLFLLLSTSLFAQSNVEKLFSDIKDNQTIILQNYNIQDNNVDNLVHTFNHYLPELDSRKRYISYFYLQRLAQNFHITSQLKVIEFFVATALKDSDIGNRDAVIELLYIFPVESFSNIARSTLASYIVSNEQPAIQLARLGGWIGLQQIETTLVNRLNENNFSMDEQWRYHLILGRLGNMESVKRCVSMFQSAGMNDQVVFSLVPELIYLNQREAIDYLLVKILDDTPECSSPNPDSNARITCAYRLMEAVAPVIVNFPLEVDASGDLLVDDYDEALLTVRNWIEDNYQSYQLKE